MSDQQAKDQLVTRVMSLMALKPGQMLMFGPAAVDWLMSNQFDGFVGNLPDVHRFEEDEWRHGRFKTAADRAEPEQRSKGRRAERRPDFTGRRR